jgi:WD40 repeat protein
LQDERCGESGLNSDRRPLAIALAPSGAYYAEVWDSEICVFPLKKNALPALSQTMGTYQVFTSDLYRWSGGIHTVQFGRDGESILFGTEGGGAGTLTFRRSKRGLLGLEDRGEISQYIPSESGVEAIQKGEFQSIQVWTPDHRFLFVGDIYGRLSVRLPNTVEDLIDPLAGHELAVTSLAISGDGRTLASGSADGTLALWDISRSDASEIPRLRKLLDFYAVPPPIGPAREWSWAAWSQDDFYTASSESASTRLLRWFVDNGEYSSPGVFPLSQTPCAHESAEFFGQLLMTRNIAEAKARVGVDEDSSPCAPAQDLTSTAASDSPLELLLVAPDVSREDTVNVAVGIVAQQSFGSVVLRVNGQPRTLNTDQTKGFQEQITVKLHAGQNTLELTAEYGAANLARISKSVLYQTSAGTKKPTLRFVAVGISLYKAPQLRLGFADQDAKAVWNALQKQKGGAFAASSPEYPPVIDNKATQNGINKALDWLVGGQDEETIRILYLSGHGDRDGFFAWDADSGSGTRGQISWRDLTEGLLSSTGKKILIVDACESAGAVEAINSLQKQRSGLAIFAAAPVGAQVKERKVWQHSVYTKLLLDILGLPAKDGVDLTVAALSDALQRQMAEVDPDRPPVHWTPPDIQPVVIVAVDGKRR